MAKTQCTHFAIFITIYILGHQAQGREVQRSLKPKLSGPCMNKYCNAEVVENYPHDIVDKLLENFTGHIGLYTDFIENNNDGSYSHVESRGNMSDPCRTTSEIIEPYAVEVGKGDYRFIVQPSMIQGQKAKTDKNKRQKQIYKVEKCESEGATCSDLTPQSQDDRTSCKQQYFERKVYTLKEDLSGFEVKTMSLPCCCQCNIVFVN